jgi:hypothetical protein
MDSIFTKNMTSEEFQIKPLITKYSFYKSNYKPRKAKIPLFDPFLSIEFIHEHICLFLKWIKLFDRE